MHAHPSELLMVHKSNTICEVLDLMKAHDVGCVLVLSDPPEEKLVGIFTERDLLRHIDLIRDKDAWERGIFSVMTPKVMTAPHDDLPKALALVQKHHVRHVPLVRDDKVVGIVTMRDLLQQLAASGSSGLAKLGQDLEGVSWQQHFEMDLPQDGDLKPGSFADRDVAVLDIDDLEKNRWLKLLKELNALTLDQRPFLVCILYTDSHVPQHMISILTSLNLSERFLVFPKPIAALALVNAIYSKMRARKLELQSSLEKIWINYEHLVGEFVGMYSRITEYFDTSMPHHQQRVAQLALAIGKKMKLPDTEGLYFAAVLHDIGKVSIPGRILMKKGRLIPEEKALIQTHALAGYQILQGLDVPWPLADVVYQHHERMDGSGYPVGLVGEEILLEARIIAVADVVEAMTNPESLRGGQSLTAARDLVLQGKGRLYDEDVVEAFCQLVAEKFQWRS